MRFTAKATGIAGSSKHRSAGHISDPRRRLRMHSRQPSRIFVYRTIDESRERILGFQLRPPHAAKYLHRDFFFRDTRGGLGLPLPQSNTPHRCRSTLGKNFPLSNSSTRLTQRFSNQPGSVSILSPGQINSAWRVLERLTRRGHNPTD